MEEGGRGGNFSDWASRVIKREWWKSRTISVVRWYKQLVSSPDISEKERNDSCVLKQWGQTVVLWLDKSYSSLSLSRKSSLSESPSYASPRFSIYSLQPYTTHHMLIILIRYYWMNCKIHTKKRTSICDTNSYVIGNHREEQWRTIDQRVIVFYRLLDTFIVFFMFLFRQSCSNIVKYPLYVKKTM